MSEDAGEYINQAKLTAKEARALIEAAALSLDATVTEVLTFHMLIERALDELLLSLFVRPLKIGKLNFKQKGQIIAALWTGNQVFCDRIVELALWYDDLRNGAAHNDLKEMQAAQAKISSKCLGDRGKTPRDAAGIIVGGLQVMSRRIGPVAQPIGTT